MLDIYLREYHSIIERHLATEATARVGLQAAVYRGANDPSEARKVDDSRAVKELDKQMHEMTDACILLEARKVQQSRYLCSKIEANLY